MNVTGSPKDRRRSGSRSSTATSIRRSARRATCIPFLSARWREHMTTFGEHVRHGLTGQLPYPRMMAAGMRVGCVSRAGAARLRPRR